MSELFELPESPEPPASRARSIFVAGHRGMVGAAIVQALEKNRNCNLIVQSRDQLDLTNQAEVADFFSNQSIDEVYLCAAKVGGIFANNNFPAEFIAENLQIQLNIIQSAHQAGINKLLFLGSSCIYPKLCEQPMAESALLSAGLEPTNEPYAIAKIAGIKLCESYNRQYDTDYRSVMPTNLYGENDNFHLQHGHVIPALMHRIHLAKEKGSAKVEIWGSGQARREFLHVNDMAQACLFVMDADQSKLSNVVSPMQSHINVGTGVDVSIRELAELLVKVIGYKGVLEFDTGKPDGTPRKLLDVSVLASLGWRYNISLEQGLQRTYRWFCENLDQIRKA